jgi:hypothetical protein
MEKSQDARDRKNGWKFQFDDWRITIAGDNANTGFGMASH